MIHRPVRTDCNQPWLEVEANLLAHKNENEDSTNRGPGVLSLESMPFQVSPGFHPQITERAFTPAAVRDTHCPCCLANFAKAGLLFVRSAPAITSTIPRQPAQFVQKSRSQPCGEPYPAHPSDCSVLRAWSLSALDSGLASSSGQKATANFCGWRTRSNGRRSAYSWSPLCCSGLAADHMNRLETRRSN
jgi:hypothetical protein